MDHVVADREQWTWHEWKLTAYWFPGQTQYHGALLAEGCGYRLLFAGDSFTMAGMDDYCTGNRNPIGAGRGYHYCLRLLEELNPTHIFNCHVNRPFDFTSAQREFMQTRLAERKALLGKLIAWEDPNFGLDPHWVRCWPYDVTGTSGEVISFEVRVTNYTRDHRTVGIRPVLPPRWKMVKATGEPWIEADIERNADGSVPCACVVPTDVDPGMYVIPVNIRWGGRELREFREVRVLVQPEA